MINPYIISLAKALTLDESLQRYNNGCFKRYPSGLTRVHRVINWKLPLTVSTICHKIQEHPNAESTLSAELMLLCWCWHRWNVYSLVKLPKLRTFTTPNFLRTSGCGSLSLTSGYASLSLLQSLPHRSIIEACPTMQWMIGMAVWYLERWAITLRPYTSPWERVVWPVNSGKATSGYPTNSP